MKVVVSSSPYSVHIDRVAKEVRTKPVYLSQVTKTIVCEKPEIESLGDKVAPE